MQRRCNSEPRLLVAPPPPVPAAQSTSAYCLFILPGTAALASESAPLPPPPPLPSRSAALRADSAPPSQLPSFALPRLQMRGPPQSAPIDFSRHAPASRRSTALPTVGEEEHSIPTAGFASNNTASPNQPIASEFDEAAAVAAETAAISRNMIDSLGTRWIAAVSTCDATTILALLQQDPFEIATTNLIEEYARAQEQAKQDASAAVLAAVAAKAFARGTVTTEDEDRKAAAAATKAGEEAAAAVPLPLLPELPSLVNYFDPKSGNTALMLLCSRGARDGAL